MEIPITLEIKQNGSVFSGSMSSPHGDGTLENGKVDGKIFKGTIKATIMGQVMDLEMEGTIDGDTMTGTLSNPQLPPISFTAKKGK